MSFLWFLSGLRTPAGEAFFQAVTNLGKETFAVAIVCFVFWCISKKLACTMAFSYFISALIVNLLKILFRVPRPWVLDPAFHAVEAAVPDATGYSFPSGHTQCISSILFVLALTAKKTWQKAVCLLTILLVGFSRMYLGVHTPKDVIAGLLIGLVSAVVCWYFVYKEGTWLRAVPGIAVLMAVLSCIVGASGLILYENGTLEAGYAADCMKASGAGVGFALGFWLEYRFIEFTVPGSIAHKAVVFLLGGAGAMLILAGLKPVLGTSLPASFARYFLCMAWVFTLYPIVFDRIGKKKA